MPVSSPHAPFFVAGGTVPPGSPSYVERAADRELLEALLAGEFCYVLNSRQMGKSSLAVRTIARLNEAGVTTAFVDLTRIGSAGAAPERWYAGLLVETGRALGLRGEALAYLRANPEVPATTRLFSFLRDEALVRTPDAVVLMIDEIDAVRTLPFSVDDLFAGLRELVNARATDSALRRLTVCLLGAALPSDLIRDPRTTPFNVGRRIELRDFTSEEARPFAAQVGEAALTQILHWTNGHPFLTQALCAEISNAPALFSTKGERPSAQMVDALVQSRYLDARARETDTNLADVGRRLLGEGDPSVMDEDRADTLSLYERTLRGKSVPDDESNPSAARIKMSGVAHVEDGLLKVRNRIYREAFDAKWVRENTPGQELRRQRRAFWKGAIRTGAIAMAVVAAIGGLAWNNARLAHIAQEQGQKASYEAYVSSMNLIPSVWREANREKIRTILDRNRDNPNRGWEWDFWNARIGGSAMVPASDGIALSPDGRTLAARLGEWVTLFNARSLEARKRFRVPGREFSLHWVRGGLLTPAGEDEAVLVDPDTERVVRRYPIADLGFLPQSVSPDGRTVAALDPQQCPVLIDMATGRRRSVPLDPAADYSTCFAAFSPDGQTLYWRAMAVGEDRVVGFDVQTLQRRIAFCLGKGERVYSFAPSPDGRWLAVGTAQGRVWLFDTASGRLASVTSSLGRHILWVAFSSDGRRFVATTGNRRGAVFSLDAGALHRTGDLRGFFAALFLPNSHLMIVSYTSMQSVDADSVGQSSLPRLTSGLPAGGVAWSGKRLLAMSGRGASTRIFALDAAGGGWRTIDSPRGNGRLDPDSGLAYVHRTKTSVIRDVERGQDLLVLPSSSPLNPPFAADLERRFAAVQTGPRHLDFWDLRQRRQVGSQATKATLCCWRFSSAGDRLAIGYADGGIELLDTATWRPLWNGIKILGTPLDFDFSLDGKRMVVAADYDDALVLDEKKGAILLDLVGHGQTVLLCRFSPDGKRVVTASRDQTVRLWDASTGREMTTIDDEGLTTTSLRYSPDGRSLWGTMEDGQVRVWSSRP